MKNLIYFSILLISITTNQIALAGTKADTNIISACNQTVHNYAVYRDALNAKNYAAAFAEDGKFITPQKIFSGRTEISNYIANQPQDIQTLHHITTTQIIATNEDEAKGVIYAQVYFSEKNQQPGTVYREAHAIYRDLYRLNNGQCEILSRSLQILTDDQVSK